jgi:hypothetical protein
MHIEGSLYEVPVILVYTPLQSRIQKCNGLFCFIFYVVYLYYLFVCWCISINVYL